MELTQREEQYFAKMAGETESVPAPVTRMERILAKMSGEDIDITPLTREEQLLSKIEVGGGGGGGDSDFSTAEVIIEGATEAKSVAYTGAIAVDYHDPEYPEDDDSYSSIPDFIKEDMTLTAILYKGKAFAFIEPKSGASISVSGNIEALFMEDTYFITGDCKITVS